MKNIFKAQKKPKLSPEEKKALKREKRLRFFAEVRDGAAVFYKNRWLIFSWCGLYLLLAILSLFFTSWTVSQLSDFPLVITNSVPRVFSLMLLTFPAFSTKFRKTFFAGGATVWAVWMLLLSDVSYGAIVVAACIGVTFFSGFLRYEVIKGNENTPSPLVGKVCKWFYLFAALTLIVEIIHRIDVTLPFANIYAPFVSIIKNPDIFALNFMVIMFFGLFVFLVKKRKYAFTVYSCVWIVLAFISFLKYSNVYEPVLLLDVFQVFDAFSALTKYYTPVTIVLFVILFVALIGALVFLSTKDKGVKVHSFLYPAILLLALAVAGTFFGVRNLSYTQSVEKFVRQNYFTYGFSYSFINYALNSQVDMPEEYSETKIEEIIATVEDEYKAPENAKETQNVIVLQLESFVDPYLFAAKYPELEFEEDPIPFLRQLSEKYSSGNVAVPVFGGQTVKSEFEFLSGISLNNMPKGYNPYVSYLYENSIDNLVRFFKSEGYTATAVHNYQGEFFSRNQVYENLGFDTFISYECMSGVEKKENAIWANDQRLVDELLEVIDSTEGKDFVMGVTVQLHGNYFPLEESEYTMEIKGIPEEDKEFEGQIAYYVSQLQAFDKALENLMAALEEREESTYVIMYSDHLPKLFYDYDELTETQKFTTQYFTWNNMGLEKKDGDMELSQLSTKLCNDLSVSGTFINKFHNVYSEKSEQEYAAAQEIVDYHLLIVDANKEEFKNGDYKIGLYPLNISAVIKDAEFEENQRYVIYGNEITDNTVVSVNGHTYDLIYKDENTAYLEPGDKELATGDELLLRIIGERNGTVLQESKKVTYNAEDSSITETEEETADGGEVYED